MKMWLYYWGFTERQVDLILMDQPVIVYDHDKKKTKGKGSKPENVASSEGDVLLTEAKWKQKKAEQGDKELDTGFLKAFGAAKKVKMYEQADN